jgi:hypothetical protein
MKNYLLKRTKQIPCACLRNRLLTHVKSMFDESKVDFLPCMGYSAHVSVVVGAFRFVRYFIFLSKFGMLKKYYIMFLRGTTSIPKDKVYILIENQSIQSLGEDIHTNINI